MRVISILFALLVPFTVFAAQETYVVVPASSQVTFEVSAQVHHVHGVSQALSGTITGDPGDITTAHLEIKLDPKTFNTNNDSRDQVMREKSLKVDKYPSIEFVSSGVQSEQKALISGQPAKATIQGTLKLHGMEKQVSIPVTINWQDTGVMTADGDLALVLDDWGRFRPKVVFFRLSHDIKIHCRIGARRETQ